MRNILFLCSLVLLMSQTAYAHACGGGETDSTRLKNMGASLETQILRSFPDLDKYVQQNSAPNQPFNAPYAVTSEFTADYITNTYPVSDVIADDRAQATQTFSEIDRLGRFIDVLTSQDLVELPLGMKKRLGNSNVTIGIAKAKFKADYAELTIFCKIDLPQGKTLFFGSDNVKLTYSGGIFGSARLVLLGDFQIPINGGNSMLILKGGLNMQTGEVIRTDVTSVTITCSSVENLSIKADVVFPRSLIEPVGSDFKVIADQTKKVTGSLIVTSNVTDFNNIYADISLPKFAIRGLSKVCFEVKGAVFDFSDTRNPGSLPTNYGNIPTGNTNLWRGVFIQSIDVYLPKEFKKKGIDERVKIEGTVGTQTIEGRNIIIDNWGFTGLISATDVFQDGTASGWDFSIDKFEINVQANTLRGANFEGSIAIPLTKKKTNDTQVKQYGFGYRAIFTADNSYMMAVELKQGLSFDIWKATVNLEAGSNIKLTVQDDVFRPTAYLNGSMGIIVDTQKEGGTATDTKRDAQFTGVTFTGLELSTVAPYMNVKSLGYKSSGNFASSFPITINRLYFGNENGEVTFGATVKLNLMEQANFNAGASVRVIGKLESTASTLSYTYNRVELDSADVHGDFGGFTIDGEIKIFRKHPVMGNGFSGSLTMVIKVGSGNPTGFSIAGAFGTAPSAIADKPFRYWYVDALVSIPQGIPIVPGLDITAIGGGASYGMKKSTELASTPSIPASTEYSFTGTKYLPDVSRGLSLRVMVSLAIKGDAGHADACLEMTFNTPEQGGGLARIGLFGKAQIMPPQALTNAVKDLSATKGRLNTGLNNFTTGLTDEAGFNALVAGGKFKDIAKTNQSTIPPAHTAESTITAELGIEYNFATKTLVGNIDANMNVAGMLTGNGTIRLKFAPSEWYIYVGEPDPAKRFKVTLSASGIKNTNNPDAGISLGAYFVIGSTIPNSPPSPAEVANILGVKANALDYMRDVNALGGGKGFAFGASFAASTGDLNGGIFYAKFSAGAGFDIMIKKYPENTTYACYAPNGSQTASGTTFGLNGWYANGQAYAYLQGELGIRIKIFDVEKKIPIIKGEAAVLLQAKLPNPSWFPGHMAGSYSVLAGTFSGRFSMKITLGQENCRFNSAPPEREKFITSITPDSALTDVDVMANITTTFRYPLNNHFTVSREDFNDPDAVDVYSAMRSAFEVKNVATNQLVAGTFLNTGGDDLVFQPNDFLAANTTYSVRVVIRIDKKRGEGWWQIEELEEKITTFTTGEAPQGIPLSNIEYSYPAAGQKYFHVGESNQGFIKLKRGMQHLFTTTVPNSTINLGMNITVKRGNNFEFFGNHGQETKYDPVNNIISFNLPNIAGNNPNQGDAECRLYIARIQTFNNGSFGYTGPMSEIVTFDFKLSKYPTFAAKMAAKFNNATRTTTNLPLVGGANVPVLNATSNIVDEPFDETELYGTKGTSNKPLIRAENSAFQIVYHWPGGPVYWYSALESYFGGYLDRLISSWLRDEGIETHNNKKAGWPLVRTLEISPEYKNAMRNPENAEFIAASGGVANTVLQKMMPFSYMAAKYYKEDFDFCKDYLYYKYLCPIVIGSGNAQGGSGNSSGGGANFSGDGDGNANVPNPTNCTPLAIPSYLNELNDTPTFPPMLSGNYPVAFKYTLPNGHVTSTYNFNFVKQ